MSPPARPRCPRPARARAPRAAVLLAPWLLAGCGSVRMVAPGAFGMDRVDATPLRSAVYVEPSVGAAERAALVEAIARGRARVEAFFGPLESTPLVAACASAACARRYGSEGERASAFGDGAIRLSRLADAEALVAHEWVHTEVYRRLGGWWVAARLPRWFDEGLAVVVADEPRHSETNWQEIRRRGLAVPALADLVTRAQWTAAVQRHGETAGDVPENLRVVYTTAGHEVRRWLGCAGTEGTRALLAAVRDGEPFETAYARLGGACTATVPG